MLELIIFFDGQYNDNDWLSLIKRYPTVTTIDLFPLTSDFQQIVNLQAYLKNHYQLSVKLINSAILIENAFDQLKQTIATWSSTFSDTIIHGRSLKQWLLLPDKNISTWWYTQMAEKSTFLTPAFFQMAQINAIQDFLSARAQTAQLVIAVQDKRLSASLIKLCQMTERTYHLISLKKSDSSHWLNRWRTKLSGFDRLGNFILGLIAWCGFAYKSFLANKLLKESPQPLLNKTTFLFVTYFPNIDQAAAKTGKFKNKYAPYLQDLLEEQAIPITWLLIPVPFDGYRYKDALILAREFQNHQQNVLMLPAFLSATACLKGLALWLKQSLLSLYLYTKIDKKKLCQFGVSPYALPIIRSLWFSSLMAYPAVNGIAYTLMFENLFKKSPQLKTCLYYFEMQGWEKALNAMKRKYCENAKTIAYQHNAISKHYLHYFYDEATLKQQGLSTDIPLPDVIAANGDLMHELLKDSHFNHVVPVEAIRQLYLADIINQAVDRKSSPAVVIAGGYNKKETMSLIQYVKSALTSKFDYQLIFKGHPTLPIQPLLDEVNFSETKVDYTIYAGALSDLLATIPIVLTVSGNVAIEALAFGCEVISPILADSLNLSGLAGFHEYYHSLYQPDELNGLLKKLDDGYKLKNIQSYHSFLNRYWRLDKKLSGWRKLIQSNEI